MDRAVQGRKDQSAFFVDRRDMESDAIAVEKYISEIYTEPGLIKVVSVQATPAVPPGENFLSLIWRLSLRILLDGKGLEEKSFIFKQMPEDESRRKVVIKSNVFQREIEMYELVLKKMDSIITEYDVSVERPWCDFIFHNNYEEFLLQDLKPLGYTPADKVKGLSLDEARLVFEAVGRYHALSKVAIERGDVKINQISQRRVLSDPNFIKTYVVRSISFTSRAVKESWGPHWTYLADKLDKPEDFIINKMIDTCAVKEDRFNTILHGDLWTNNILIKKGALGESKAVKFIDFQLSSYNTIGLDLTYLAYTSIRHDMRKEHFKHLLKVYSNSLEKNLKAFGYPTNDIPTYDYILNEIKRLRFYALITIVLYYAIVLTGITGNKQDSMALMSENCSVPPRTPEIFKTQLFKDIAAEDILELINEGAID